MTITLLVPRWAGQVGQWQGVCMHDMCEAKIEQWMQLVQLASGRSISWRSLFMNCAMLIGSISTIEQPKITVFSGSDEKLIQAAYFVLSILQAQAFNLVCRTTWRRLGKSAREIPETSSYTLAFGTIRQSIWGQKPQQRPEVIRRNIGRELHRMSFLTSQRVTGRASPNWTTLLFRAETLTLELLEMGMFFFGHLTMYNRTQKLNIKIGFSLCHSRPR